MLFPSSQQLALLGGLERYTHTLTHTHIHLNTHTITITQKKTLKIANYNITLMELSNKIHWFLF